MNALLRLQAVVVARTTWLLIVIFCLAPLGWGIPAAAVIAILGMVQTFRTLDTVRWTSPVRPESALAAHFLFWIPACALPAAAVLAALGTSVEPREAIASVALALWAIAIVPTVVTLGRVGTSRQWVLYVGGGAILLTGATLVLIAPRGLLTESIVAAGAGSAFVLACAVWFCTRGERLPALPIAELAPGRRPGTAPQQPHPRSLASSLTLGSWGSLLGFVSLGPLLYTPHGSRTLWVVAAVIHAGISILSLVRCRWILATPIERKRAFRIVIAPAAVFALVVSTAIVVMPEFTYGRTGFFSPGASRYREALDDFNVRQVHPEGFGPAKRERMFTVPGPAPGPVTDDEGYVMVQRALEPVQADVPYLAPLVREKLWTMFALDVPTDRIEASLRRGLPEGVHCIYHEVGWWGMRTAMAHVHDEFEDEILEADRIRCAALAVGVLLGFLAVVRALLSPRRMTVLLACAAVVFLMTWDWGPGFVDASIVHTVRETWLDSLAFARTSPLAIQVLIGAGVFAAIALLWKSAQSAFRRLEITDLPAPGTPWRWTWTRPRGTLLFSVIED